MYEVAVVGARGFIGGALTRFFAEIASLDVAAYTSERPAVHGERLDSDIASAKTIVWCASRINPRLAADHPHLVAQDESEFRAFVNAVEALPSPPRIVLLSSGGTVYGPPATPPFSESIEPAPVNAYGRSKLTLERALADSPVPSVSLRISNAYGPGQRPAAGQGVLAHWMTAVRDGKPVVVLGAPEATRDYVFIDDICEAVLAVHRSDAQLPQALNIGSGVPTTLNELASALEAAVAPRPVLIERGPARSTDATHSVLDISLARSVLGWSPQVSVADGVTAMWTAFTS